MRSHPLSEHPRNRILALLTAHGSSQLGNAISVLATPFLVLELGGTGLDVGLASTAATLPVILGGPLGGVVVDRMGYRRASLIADCASGVTVAAIGLLALFGLLTFPLLLVLLVLGGLLDTPGSTAKNVLLPELAAAAGWPLTRAVALASGIERAALMIGAPLGGLLVLQLGPGAAYLSTALCFALAVVGIRFTRDSVAARPARAPENTAGFWRELVEGFHFVWREPVLRLIALTLFAINLLDAARFSVLLPLIARDLPGGAATIGGILAALGAGALGGALLSARFGHRVPRRAAVVIALFTAGLPLSLALGLGADLTVVWIAAAVTGIAAGILNPITGTIRLERCPPALRARVQTVMITLCWAGIPAGSILAGIAADALGASLCFLIIGGIYSVVALIPLASRSSWGSSTPPGSPGSTSR